jgi:hypothetical protein
LLTVGVWGLLVQKFVEPKPAMAQVKKAKYDMYMAEEKTNRINPSENSDKTGNGSLSVS